MQVTRVVDGQEAVEIFAEKSAGTFNLILMDMMMPRMNGCEVTRAIRTMNNRPDGQSISSIAIKLIALAFLLALAGYHPQKQTGPQDRERQRALLLAGSFQKMQKAS